jgi:glycosyltransferase involved in cell wall biosynthesis
MLKQSDYIWITWENQRRNISMSKRLGAELHQWDVRWPAILRYPLLSLATIFTIIVKRPKVVFVQNPSVVLAIVAGLWCKVLPPKLFVDAHNGGLFPFEGKKPWATRLAKLALILADRTIVTNPNLAKYVVSQGGRATVVPDPLPFFPEVSREAGLARDSSDINVLFICTWAEDEPYLQVIDAARKLKPAVKIRITGNFAKRREQLPSHIPDNVILLGYLDDAKYIEELRAADIAVDLTTREDCLVCGAYESVALDIPAILSDTEAIRDYFSKGVIYTRNDENSIVDSIERAISELEHLRVEARELHEQIDLSWQKYLTELQSHM